MSALSITTSEVQPTTLTEETSGIAGATIAAGDLVYYDPTAKTWKLFDANDSAANTRKPRVALSGGTAGQVVTFAVGGDLVIGVSAAPVVGTVYVASATPGKICPAADLASGWKTVVVGVGKTGSKLDLILHNSGQAVP